MLPATRPPVVFTRIRQRDDIIARNTRKAQFVTPQHFFGQHLETHPLQAARSLGKTQFNDFVVQTDRFKDLGTLVRLQCRDSHLAHDLEHAFGNTFTVRSHNSRIISKCCSIELAVPACLPQRLQGEIRIDRINTKANQQAMVVYFAGLPGLDHQSNAGAFR